VNKSQNQPFDTTTKKNPLLHFSLPLEQQVVSSPRLGSQILHYSKPLQAILGFFVIFLFISLVLATLTGTQVCVF
jgi:hypothetical protein